MREYKVGEKYSYKKAQFEVTKTQGKTVWFTTTLGRIDGYQAFVIGSEFCDMCHLVGNGRTYSQSELISKLSDLKSECISIAQNREDKVLIGEINAEDFL